MARLLNDEEITRQLQQLPGWSRSEDAIVATIEAPDFPAAIRIVTAVADQAESMNHHPDIDIRWRKVTLRFVTHDAGNAITDLDARLAKECSLLFSAL